MIHNVDKTPGDRSNPTPNIHDTIANNAGRMFHGTTSVNYLPPGQLPSAQSPLLGGFIRLVATDTVQMINNGSASTVTTVAHNLGYVPFIIATLLNSSLPGISDGGTTSIPLPTWTQATQNTDIPAVEFGQYISAMVDATNAYFYFLNAARTPSTLNVTYYLYQQTTGTV